MRTHREKKNNNSYTPTPEATEQYKYTPKKRKTKVAETSIEAWHTINERQQPQKEKDKVLSVLPIIQPATSRIIAAHLGIERTNITRSINDLVTAGKAKIALKATCPTSGLRVCWYSLADWEAPATAEKGGANE